MVGNILRDSNKFFACTSGFIDFIPMFSLHIEPPSYYERYQLTEKLLSGEVRSQIDTCIEDYCQVKSYTYF